MQSTTNVFLVTFSTKISTNVIIDSPILTSQMISNARITCKQQTDQSQLRDLAINHQAIEMVSIRQICQRRIKSCATCHVRQAILSLDKVARQNCATLSCV